ncbi:MAG: hypothetical protein K2X87_34165 [Gemmataceae bacterium]|nr:hypothetical protein [Gemmataceae bacterium]
MSRTPRTRLGCEALEARDNPAGLTESFDAAAPPALPAGWAEWSNDGSDAFATAAGQGTNGTTGLVAAGGSRTAGRAWSPAPVSADTGAAVSVKLDSAVPVAVFARGRNLGTAAPSYLAASVSRGAVVTVWEVTGGAARSLGSVRSPGSAYLSGPWVRVSLLPKGDTAAVRVVRQDTGQYLNPAGRWQAAPADVLSVRTTAAAAPGYAGVARLAEYWGPVRVDDFQTLPPAGPTLRLTRLGGSGPATGSVTFRAEVTGESSRVEFRLDNQVRQVTAGGTAEWTLDTSTLADGRYTVTARATDADGNRATDGLTLTVAHPSPPPSPPPPTPPGPAVPRHYGHIRVAALAYAGNPMGAFEQGLLRDSIDLVVPNTRYLSTIDGASPRTPQLIYSNVSNLYQGLLTDWLGYADRTGADREDAFYHVAGPTAYTGNSGSSRPVDQFWGAYQGGPGGGGPADITSAVRSGGRPVGLGATGQWTALGYTEKFREINVTLARGGNGGWGGAWEYPTAVDAAGAPTAWAALPANDDTGNLRQTGRVVFDPQPDWVPASVGGSARLYYVRFRVLGGDAAQAAQLATAFGRDFVGAAGRTSGTIPAFDAAADANGDGYLTDAEYSGRAAGKDARFEYESRLFYPYYGPMRFVTDPSSAAFRGWAADYHARFLAANPLADGVMLDNSTGRLPFAGTPVLEPTADYSADAGELVAAVSRAIAPKWVMANTVGGGTAATPTAAAAGAVFEEFLLRPLDHNWQEVADAAAVVSLRLAAPGSPLVVLDSLPTGGSPTDPRTQLATLAYYYLVADPDRTMVMFFGGYSPGSSWAEHWVPAAAVDVGRPAGGMTAFATGADPQNPALTYQVLSREYANARVLYKPLSYARGRGEGTRADATATTHALGGNYRAVAADGTLGPVVTSITLRNGEGAVLVRA